MVTHAPPELSDPAMTSTRGMVILSEVPGQTGYEGSSETAVSVMEGKKNN